MQPNEKNGEPGRHTSMQIQFKRRKMSLIPVFHPTCGLKDKIRQQMRED
jgi:hypothetical protein